MAVKDRSNTPWLTREEAAAYARCSVKVITSLVKTGALPACQPLGAAEGYLKPHHHRQEDISQRVIRGRMVKRRWRRSYAAGSSRRTVT